MNTHASIQHIGSAPVVQPTISRAKISSFEELESCGIDYKNLSKDTAIVQQMDMSSSFVVTECNSIFASSLTDPCFQRSRSILNGQSIKPRIFVCDESIIVQILKFKTSKASDDEQGNIYSGKQSDAQKAFEDIVKAAVKHGSSDIRIFSRTKNTGRVLFKIKGAYKQISQFSGWDQSRYLAILRASVDFTVSANNGDSKINFTTSKPSDIQIPYLLEGYGTIKLRMSILPAEFGSLCVSIRIPQLGSDIRIKTHKELGLADEHIALIEDAMRAPYGLILFTGPTGSGKTTSLSSSLQLLPDNVPCITLEDPVEISLQSKPSITQTPVFDKDPDLGWVPLLRQVFRQDPDVIMIGEIRGSEVASIMSRAASSGHLVLSSLHVNSVIDIPGVLHHYGIPLHKIAENSFLRLLVAQRITKGVCLHCSTLLKDTKQDNRDIRRIKHYFSTKQNYELIRIANLRGCEKCDYTGNGSVHLIAEVVQVDARGRHFILKQQYDLWRQHLLKMGWHDMKHHAEQKVLNGLVCPIEAEKNIISPFGKDINADESFDYGNFRSELEIGDSVHA